MTALGYFLDHAVIYDTKDRPKSYNIKRGVPQEAVIGLLLWNIMYDAVLKLPMLEDRNTIESAHDVAIVMYLEEVTQMANYAVATI